MNINKQNYESPVAEVIEMEIEGSILDGSGNLPPVGEGGDAF